MGLSRRNGFVERESVRLWGSWEYLVINNCWNNAEILEGYFGVLFPGN